MAPFPTPLRPDNSTTGVARALSRVGLVLFVVFATVIAGPLVSPGVLQPTWQWQFSSVLLSGASLPLVGLALLQLAASLDPADGGLQRRYQRCAALAVAACGGFVLLVPLQLWSGLQVQHAGGQRRIAQIEAAERQLKAMRGAVAMASSNEDLAQRFQALRAPALVSAPPNTPLSEVKAQATAAIDRAQAAVSSQRRQISQPNPLLALPDLLRNTLASLALAVGFAALARQPGASRSLLDVLRRSWQRRARSPRSSPNDYMRELRKHHSD